MGEEIIAFGDIENEKLQFHCYKDPFFSKDIDIDNILIFNKISSCEKKYKYFIAYTDVDYKIVDVDYTDVDIAYTDVDYKIKRFSIILPKTSAYEQSYDSETKWMHFLIEDKELLKKQRYFNKVSELQTIKHF